MSTPITLAIDTSCDETSVAVTCGLEIWSSIVASQVELHKPYGGVFPTVAKQAHIENIAPSVALALKRARATMADIDQIAVTVGPGLAPALEVGIEHAQELAKLHHIPLIPTNHIEGHIYSVLALQPSKQSLGLSIKDRQKTASARSRKRIDELKWPVLSLVVSGGHTQFIKVTKPKTKSTNTKPKLERIPHLSIDTNSGYTILGQSIDDAAGEALDKIGRMINLGYPAGPVVEELAKQGDPKSYDWPLPMTHEKNFNLSFSGLKTYSRNYLKKNWPNKPLNKQELENYSASLQYAIFRHICYKLNKLLKEKSFSEVWLGGGVAANITLRKMIRQTIKPFGLKLLTPQSKKLCGDNAGMIGITV
jgi:N6-L-threonylcarbamoyladenine synthase